VTDAGIRLEHLLDGLENGRITLGDAIRQVRAFGFEEPPVKGAHQRMAEDANGDPEVPADHSFYQVSRAYTLGRITRYQYEKLAEAASSRTG
jgi:hypothetical protein